MRAPYTNVTLRGSNSRTVVMRAAIVPIVKTA